MRNEPVIEDRPEQPYIGTRGVMPMSDFERQIPAMRAAVTRWLQAHGLHPSGKPFLRYHLIDMPDHMDVELGIPLDDAPEANGPVRKGALPAGRYAVLTCRGVKNGVAANKTLLDWIAEHGEEAVSHETEKGQVFKSRYETFLTDPVAETDQDQWETEVAIILRG